MKQNFRRPLIFGLLFIVYLGAIRLLHEVCMGEEDGNLLVNGGLALLLSAATYLIWRGLRSLRNHPFFLNGSLGNHFVKPRADASSLVRMPRRKKGRMKSNILRKRRR